MNLLRIHFKNGHGRVLCSCGQLAAYCACDEGHNNVVIVEKVCADCKRGAAPSLSEKDGE